MREREKIQEIQIFMIDESNPNARRCEEMKGLLKYYTECNEEG